MQERESLLTESLLQSQLEQQNKEVTFLSIFRFANPQEKIYMSVGAVSAMLAGIAFPFFLMFFGQITDIFGQRSAAEGKGFAIMIKFVLIGSIYWLLTFLSLYCWSYSGSTQSMRLKKLYYHTLLQQEVAWYDAADVGRLAAQVARNISTIENAIGEKVALLISAVFTSGFGIIFAFIHCWELSLFLTALLPLVVYSGFLLVRSHALRAKLNNASYEPASGLAEQAFSAIRTIKSLAGQLFEVSRFEQALGVGGARALKGIGWVALFTACFTFVQFGIYSLGMWLGKEVLLWNIDTHQYSPADVVGTFFCVVSGGSAFGQISPILKNLAEGKVAFADLMKLINRKKTLEEPKDGLKLKHIKRISLKNLSFSYKKLDSNSEPQQILRDVSLNFLPNRVNAIVGQSGSGKSTIVQLLLRYYDCDSGSLCINGHSIRQVNINNFRRKVGFVGQQPVLFAMSIEDNLKIANSKLTQEDIIQALKQANAWEFVEKMENGIKTYVGAGGTQLSGGQKQRIAIARAICKNPQLLILDEATSALDRKNQKEIQQTLQNLEQSNITTVVIAHRLSTIKHADRIFVLEKGELIEQGNHQQLIALNGIYNRLVHTQIQAEKAAQSEELIGPSQNLREEQKSVIAESDQPSIDEALTIEQNNKKQEKNLKQSAVLRKLLRESRPYLPYIIIGGLSSLVNGSIVPFFSMAFGNILALFSDVVRNEQDIDMLCVYFLVIALVATLTTFLYNFCFGVVGDRLVHDLRVKIFNKLLRMPTKYYDRKENTPGAISTKLSTEAYHIHNMITGIIAVVTLNSTTACIGLLIALFHCWKIAFITLAFTPFLMIATSIHMAIIKRMNSKSEKSEKFIGSLISDTVSNIRTVKSFGKISFFIKKFEENLEELNKVAFQRSLKISFFQGMRRAIIVIAQGLIFWIASILYGEGLITDSNSSIYVSLFAIIYCSNTLGQSSQHMPDIARARRSGAILFDILESKDEEQLAQIEGGNLKTEIKGDIEFKDVCFQYPERQNVVLQNFSLKINKGQKIGLVGESGSGKSTVLQLLQRLYDPISGQIFLDGHNIKDYDIYHLRQQLGVVNQQPTMFLGTVQQNIRYNTETSEEIIQQALSTACCSTFVKEWEDGLEKQVGQKGSQISGGQKQRIAIARCLIRKPSIFLFDESTSALDADTQKSVFRNLKPTLSNVTSISVAHRLSTIEDANRIIVMRDGRIIESGTYEELIRMKGSFYRLAKGK